MGNCCSDDYGGRSVVGGATVNTHKNSSAPNNKNDFHLFPKSRAIFTQIELSLSASILEEGDALCKSNPVAVLYAKGRDGALEELGRTEVVLDQSNPIWIAKHTVTYRFEAVQTLVFYVYNVDPEFRDAPDKMLKLDEQKFVGEATCALSEIITKPTRSLTLTLIRRDDSNSPQHLGNITVSAEECVGSKCMMEMILRCSDLEYKDPFSRSDPFLLISKTTETGSSIPVCKTDVKKNDLNPTWKPIFLNIQQVGSKETPLIIECFNFNSNGRHDMIGKVQKSLADLEMLWQNGQGESLILPTLIRYNNQKKDLQSQLFVEKFFECEQHTFLDYITGGCELNFMVAVDFTASNGNPRLPDSLHYIDSSGRQNPYQRVISEIGEVLQFYDIEKRFPAWGFGARAIDGPVSHCFNLNGSSSQCEVDGIQGIMRAYASAVPHLSLAGPTLFGPVINNASLIASQSLASCKQKYFVLLIITDGVITDLQETKEALVKAADLPISILVVGVGGADYKEMEVLDADKEERLENSYGQVASRHIVQFVPFRDVQSGDVSILQSLLVELQVQFLQYMRTKDTYPQN
ncbi:hypothetical protein GIB67_004091 [Kingdonia uniflora]|uniref:Uncharacterized protein n=1 Tax=Kingdonia uniflora TaxID=39325 RepID=A0A7J7NRA3_9MAGN|nr:hypothetical protein GIB67_004091 [Kingdonia uniflora]